MEIDSEIFFGLHHALESDFFYLLCLLVLREESATSSEEGSETEMTESEIFSSGPIDPTDETNSYEIPSMEIPVVVPESEKNPSSCLYPFYPQVRPSSYNYSSNPPESLSLLTPPQKP